MKISIEDFAKHLKTYGFSASIMSRICDIPERQMRRYFAGKVKPNDATIDKINQRMKSWSESINKLEVIK